MPRSFIPQFLRRKAQARSSGEDFVARLFAGIGRADLRDMARGSPMRRPDPRLAAHLRSFLLHIRPRYYHEAATRFTHTFRLGLLATILAIIETLTGLLLMVYYRPAPEHAYGDLVRIISQAPFGQLTRDLHRLAGEGLVAVVILHMARTFLTGSYKPPRRFTWLTGVLLLALTLLLSFSGYLLPWDQLAYWAVTIGTSLAQKIPPPALGRAVQSLLLGGPTVGADALLRFYLLHVLLAPTAGLLIFGVHYFKVVRAGLSLPAREEAAGQDTARRVPVARRRYTIPGVLVDEALLTQWVLLALIGAIALGIYAGAPFGAHADPQRTPVGIAAPWYFLWVQGLLKLGDATILGVFAPLALFALLLAWPYLDRNPSRRPADRRGALALFAVAVVVWGALTWHGRPQLAPLSAPQAVAQCFLPDMGGGALRALDWAALQDGEWDTRTIEISSAPPPLRALVQAIGSAWAEPADAGQAATRYAKLVVASWQVDLKKVSLRLFWAEPGQPVAVYEITTFIHRGQTDAQR